MRQAKRGTSLIAGSFKKWREICTLALLLWISATEAHAGNDTTWAIKKIGGNAAIGTARWCGTAEKMVWQGVTSGIHLADLPSGSVKTITEFWQHTAPFCSPDGRFVFFMDESINKTKAYDLKTSKITTIECLSKEVVLSPDMKAALSVNAKGCESIDLPWGETIPIKRITGVQNQGGELSSTVIWFSDRKKVILTFIEPFSPKKLSQRISAAVYDLASTKLVQLQLPQNPYRIRVSEDGKSLFYLGGSLGTQLNELNNAAHLFKADMEHIPTKIEQVQSNVSDFDVSPQHGMAILRNDGEVLIGVSEKSVLKQASRQKMSNTLKFSPDGHKVLLMKQDPFRGAEGPEGPPITNSIYILLESQK